MVWVCVYLKCGCNICVCLLRHMFVSSLGRVSGCVCLCEGVCQCVHLCARVSNGVFTRMCVSAALGVLEFIFVCMHVKVRVPGCVSVSLDFRMYVNMYL